MVIVRLVALACFAALRWVAAALARRLDIDPSQPVYRVRGPWCALPYDRKRVEVYAILDGGGPAWAIARVVHRWGPVAVVVESAQDGGGETWVLDARDEASTAAAAETLRLAWESMEAVATDRPAGAGEGGGGWEARRSG